LKFRFQSTVISIRFYKRHEMVENIDLKKKRIRRNVLDHQ